MVRRKEVKLVIDSYGNYLGMEKGCMVLKDRHGTVTRYPLFEAEIGEVILKNGNMISTGLLSSLGFWEIDVLITTRNGQPIAMLKNLEDDSHVKTRICQYEALKNGKGCYLAKQFVAGKIEGQSILLKKYGLVEYSVGQVENILELDLDVLRRRLMHLEGKFGKHYFTQIFQLFPESIRPTERSKFKAYDGVNNVFNLAYRILFWKCYRALIKAHLEPYLGFLHKVQFGRPSLVCDFMELYRYLVDNFLIEYCQTLRAKDFIAKAERWGGKKGKRIYLNDILTRDLTLKMHGYFRRMVCAPRMRAPYAKKQEVETLISEEAFLIAKYLRNERKNWIPRIAVP
jgi:CRISPR-associated protein Cas1